MASSSSRIPEEGALVVELGKHLRSLREAAGLVTQAALAARLNVSHHYVSKCETDKLVPSEKVFLAWLDACAASAEARRYISEIWVIASTLRGVIPQFARPWLEAEAEAAYLQLWSYIAVPGVLQTYNYAHAMFLLGDLDEETAAESAAARVRRRRLIEGPDGTRVTSILHESVLHRRVGSPEVMGEQLEDLLELSRQPNLIIQVVKDNGYFFGLEGEFMVASGHAIPDTLNMVTVVDQTTTDLAMVDRATGLFERIRGHALTIEDSRSVIQEARQRWSQQQ